MVKVSETRAVAARTSGLGRAIRRHRGVLSLDQLAGLLGASQASVSSWERGGVDLTCEQVAMVERRLGLRRGTLLVEAGYVDRELVGEEVAALMAVDRVSGALDTLLRLVVPRAREEG